MLMAHQKIKRPFANSIWMKILPKKTSVFAISSLSHLGSVMSQITKICSRLDVTFSMILEGDLANLTLKL